MKHCFIFCSALVAILSCHAQNWSAVGHGIDNDVRCFYGDTITNILYAGGNFWKADNIIVNSIGRYSNESWDSLKSGTDNCTNQCFPVTSICKFNGEIYASGMFPGMDGVPNTKGIAKWNGLNWQSVGGTDGVVFSLIVYNNYLYALGGYDSIGGISAFSIAKYDGNNWYTVADTIFKSETIACSGIYQGELYVGSSFHIPSLGAQCIAKYNGAVWSSPGNTGLTNAAASVSDFEVFQNKLYAVGYFSQTTGAIGNGIICWDGNAWTNVGNGLTHSSGFTPNVDALCIHDGKLFVGGGFSSAGGIPANCLASWDGTLWCGYGSPLFTNGIFALTSFKDTLYIGGGFTDLEGDTNVDFIAKWIGGNYVDTCGNLNGFSNLYSDNDFVGLFPNPASLNVTFQFGGSSELRTILIYDQFGREIWRKETEENRVEFCCEELSRGLYFYKIQARNELIGEGKFIVN